jgi:hypothetical protein
MTLGFLRETTRVERRSTDDCAGGSEPHALIGARWWASTSLQRPDRLHRPSSYLVITGAPLSRYV